MREDFSTFAKFWNVWQQHSDLKNSSHFLDQVFIHWFWDLADGMPAKFLYSREIKKHPWTETELALLHDYANQKELGHAYFFNGIEKDFLGACCVYGVVFLELLCSPVLPRESRVFFQDVLFELNRLRQHTILRELVCKYTAFVDFETLLMCLERAYSLYSNCDVLFLDSPLSKIVGILDIFSHVQVAFEFSRDFEDQSMRELPREIKPVLLVQNPANNADFKARFSRMLQLLICVTEKRIEDVFGPDLKLLLKHLKLTHAAAWVDEKTLEKKLFVIEALLGFSFVESTFSRLSIFNRGEKISGALNHVMDFFDKGVSCPPGFERVHQKKIKKLVSLGWLFGGALTRCAPFTGAQLSAYRLQTPKGIDARRSALMAKIKKNAELIDVEARFCDALQKDPVLAESSLMEKGKPRPDSLFACSLRNLQEYQQQLADATEALAALEHRSEM